MTSESSGAGTTPPAPPPSRATGTDDRTGRPPTLRDRMRGRDGEEKPAPAPWRVEGMPDKPAGPAPQRRGLGGFWWVLLAVLAVNWILMLLFTGPAPRTDVSYTFFTDQVAAGNVQTVTSAEDAIMGEFKKPVDYPPGAKDAAPVDRFATQRPAFAQDDLLAALEAKDVPVNAEPPDAGAPLWAQLLLGFGPTLLLLGLAFWFIRRSAAAAAGGALGGFGRSPATRYEPENGKRATFADVAGIDD